MMIPVLFFLVSLPGNCLSVAGERITAKDLSRAVPEFAALPEGLSLGLAPLPGAHRGFTGSDIQRIAHQYGIETAAHDTVCFEWPMRRLQRDEVLEAIHGALGQPGEPDRLELEEYSLFPVPPGPISFPVSALNGKTDGSFIWRGSVQYSEHATFTIWAKVKLHGSVTLASGSDVVGGSRVNVTVRSGSAELRLEAQAISSGLVGQTVAIRNPKSGRSFSAQVTGKDQVLVVAGSSPGETGK